MTGFGHLRQLDITKEHTVEFMIHQITVNGRTPTLIVAPATEANKPYFNALLKRAGRSARQVRSGNVNAGLIEENREEDRALYPMHVIKGWKDVVDENGVDTPYSTDDCVNFLEALPGWLFDDIRNFCGNPTSFSEVMDVEINAGN